MNDTAEILIVFVIILASMILHELAHGVVAYLLGDETAKREGRLSLNPLVHLDPILSIALPFILYLMKAPVIGGAKPVPINTKNLKWGVWGMALVGIAGPLVNILIAFLAYVWCRGAFFTQLGSPALSIAVDIVNINLSLATFNLLPIPPLDGSRVLYAIAPDGVRSVMERLEGTVGIAIVFALILLMGKVIPDITSWMTQGIINFFDLLVG